MKTEKPWGSEEIIYSDDKYTVKRLFIKQGHRTSLQYHQYKQETVYVLHGNLKINDTILYPDTGVTIFPYDHHRMEGLTDATYLECSTSELGDVVRLADDYGRE
jgi:mannose-6-phosphate isomerase